MALLNASHDIATEALEDAIISCTQSNLDLTRERDEQSNQLLILNTQVGVGVGGGNDKLSSLLSWLPSTSVFYLSFSISFSFFSFFLSSFLSSSLSLFLSLFLSLLSRTLLFFIFIDSPSYTTLPLYLFALLYIFAHLIWSRRSPPFSLPFLLLLTSLQSPIPLIS
jgi:hypothetical protein